MTGRKIFVCYRREDSAGHAGRLYDRLNLRFPGRVFMDVAGIGLGTRWAEVIEQTLASCEVVLLLIGRRWLEADATGRRRLDDPDDPLRAEITTALKLTRRIVPVLVGGAAMPDRSELPADVAPAADWQAIRVDDDDFDHDAQRLTRALEGYLQEHSADPHLEQDAARRTKIEALFAESERATAAGAWVTAAQTLRSVLSLDPGNARATAALRDVEARWAAAWQQGQRRPVVATRRRPWALVGVVGTLAVLGAVALTLLVAVALYVEGVGDTPVAPVYDEGAPYPPLVDADEPAPDPETPVAPLVGRYQLAGYSQHGTPLPLQGELTLEDGGQGRLQYLARFMNVATGEGAWYRGVLQRQGTSWTTTTSESSDQAAVSQPIPTVLSFDGSVLTTANAYGEAAVWHKQ